MRSTVTLAGYDLIELIHQGQLTVIYRGREQSSQRPVILKMLQPASIASSDQSEITSQANRLRHEYEITAGLDLKGVITADALVADQDPLALVYTDFGGQSLKQWLTAYQPSLQEILRIAVQLATALESLHQHQIIHKDVKPSNIIINPQTGQVKLTDFSIATRLSPETQPLVHPSRLEGTLAYMSPEQTGRINSSLDYRSDFYALGVTLYELLTRQLPFQSEEPLELVHCHLAKQPLPIQQLQPQVPTALAVIVSKLMAKSADDRYQSATELITDLQHCLTEHCGSKEDSLLRVNQLDISQQHVSLQQTAQQTAQRLSHEQPPAMPISQQYAWLRSKISSSKTLETLVQTTAKSTSTTNQILDWATVIKATQTISSELSLDRLLEQLLHLILENTAAQQGCIILERHGELVVAVADTSQDTSEVILQSMPVQNCQTIPISVVQHVAQMQQPLVIQNAAVEAISAADPYVLRTQPKSLLCSPMLYQGQLIGLIYLENNLLTGAFTHDRLELLQVLTTQAAIAIENARLYCNLQEKAAALQQSEARLRQLIERSVDAMMLADGNMIVDANQAAVEMFGCTSKLELLTIHPSQISPELQPDGRSSFEKANEMIAIAHQQGSHRFEWMHQRRNGEDFWVEISLTVVPIDDKQILFTVLREIGDRKRVETALQQANAQLEDIVKERTSELHQTIHQLQQVTQLQQTIFDSANYAMIATDTNGIIQTFNAAAQRMLGYSATEVVGKATPDRFHDAAELAARAALLSSEAGYPIDSGFEVMMLRSLQSLADENEWSYIRKDGSRFPVALSVTAVRDAEDQITGFLIIGSDITARKAAEAALKQAKEQLEDRVAERTAELAQALNQLQQTQLQMVQNEKMSMLGNLVAGVAHEINNPIGFLNGSIKNAQEYIQDLFGHLKLYQQQYPDPTAAIQANAEAIDLEFLTEDLEKLLQSMRGATDRIKNISTSLRSFSRADTEYKVSVDLHEGIDSTLMILKYRLKANEQRPEIIVTREYADLPKVECFPGQLNQVFMNLLANAIDAIDEYFQVCSDDLKAISKQITVSTAMLAAENAVSITIRDNGPGMSQAVQSRIFDHLFTTKAVGKGTGLGLSIARQIVEATHGGTITCTSSPGTGTSFVVKIPLV